MLLLQSILVSINVSRWNELGFDHSKPIYTCMSMKLIVKFMSLQACYEWNCRWEHFQDSPTEVGPGCCCIGVWEGKGNCNCPKWKGCANNGWNLVCTSCCYIILARASQFRLMIIGTHMSSAPNCQCSLSHSAQTGQKLVWFWREGS